MKLIASITTTLALVLPAASFAAGPPRGAPGGQPPGGPPTTVIVPATPSAGRWPAPTASVAAKTTAYRTYCRGESHQRVARQRGTPFATCLTAMAKLATNPTITPPVACAPETRRRVKGRRRSPFLECVIAGAQLLGTVHRAG